MNSIDKLAQDIKQADNIAKLAKHIFDNEYKEQMVNTFEKEFMSLQQKLSKDMIPWIRKRFDDYHVQRYVDKLPESDRKKIQSEINKMTNRLIIDAVGTTRLKKL